MKNLTSKKSKTPLKRISDGVFACFFGLEKKGEFRPFFPDQNYNYFYTKNDRS